MCANDRMRGTGHVLPQTPYPASHLTAFACAIPSNVNTYKRGQKVFPLMSQVQNWGRANQQKTDQQEKKT